MQTIDDIAWTEWVPEQRATLLFIIRDGQILLIHKKRGLGAGNINGPGGRIEPGETALAGAIRETEEEVGVTPTGVEPGGELFFQFVDGLALHVTVYRATDYTGALRETDEAMPIWFAVDAIPYPRMWADDIHWLPLLLEGQPFIGHFLFDDARMLDHRLALTGQN
ncbi:MAG: 8-oxo-dGTP diphosphatase [Verrucomicrobia bacterium]|nr:8-oxo-dGTP diphosphatase [Verrucomicrobiota bacterium]